MPVAHGPRVPPNIWTRKTVGSINGSIIGQGHGLFEQAEALLEFFFAAGVMAIEEFPYLMEACFLEQLQRRPFQ
jgi:hypothetical protein